MKVDKQLFHDVHFYDKHTGCTRKRIADHFKLDQYIIDELLRYKTYKEYEARK